MGNLLCFEVLMRPLMCVWTAILACMALLGSASQARAGRLLVSSFLSDNVLAYDVGTGAFQGVFASGGGLDNPAGITFVIEVNL
jgi:hypothetical protein